MSQAVDIPVPTTNAESTYAAIATSYRKGDSSLHYSLSYFREQLASLTTSMHRPLDILDVGCGTGRYFHCLANAKSITGLDLSHQMLEEANTPYRGDDIATDQITLMQADVQTVRFPNSSFDCIVSIGLFGLHVPVTNDTFRRMAQWLKPGGAICIQVMDAATPRKLTWKRALAQRLYPHLPTPLQIRLYHALNNYTVNEPTLWAALAPSFPKATILKSRNLDADRQVWQRGWFLVTARNHDSWPDQA